MTVVMRKHFGQSIANWRNRKRKILLDTQPPQEITAKYLQSVLQYSHESQCLCSNIFNHIKYDNNIYIRAVIAVIAVIGPKYD